VDRRLLRTQMNVMNDHAVKVESAANAPPSAPNQQPLQSYQMNHHVAEQKDAFVPLARTMRVKKDAVLDMSSRNPNRRAATHRVARSCPPLAVPMMYNTMDTSVSRHDAKIITEQRLARLKTLSESKEGELTNEQSNEKHRIIRLEKNRRAASSSRLKKKHYVKNMEDNAKLVARHISILEMENAHLRAMLRNSMTGPPRGFPHPQQFYQQRPAQFNPSANTSASPSPIPPPSKRSQSCGLPMNPNQQMRAQSPPLLQPLPLPVPAAHTAQPQTMAPNMRPMHPPRQWAASVPPPPPPQTIAPFQEFPKADAFTPEIGQLESPAPLPLHDVKNERIPVPSASASLPPPTTMSANMIPKTPTRKSKQSSLVGINGQLRFSTKKKPKKEKLIF